MMTKNNHRIRPRALARAQAGARAGAWASLLLRVLLLGTVMLAWDPNTETDLAGYRIYYGFSSRNYVTAVDAEKPNPTQYVITGLVPGTKYYFAATAYNSDNLESGFSNEVTYVAVETGNGDTIPPGIVTGVAKKNIIE